MCDMVEHLWTDISDTAEDIAKPLAQIGSIVPGPWQPFAQGALALNAARLGNPLGSLAGAMAAGYTGGAFDGSDMFFGTPAATTGFNPNVDTSLVSQMSPSTPPMDTFGGVNSTTGGPSISLGGMDTMGSNFGKGTSDLGLGDITSYGQPATVGQGAELAAPTSYTSNFGQGTSPGGLESLWGSVKSNPRLAIQGASSLYDMWAKNKMASSKAGARQTMEDQLSQYGAPGSPEYEMMKQELARKDAAAGRLSQYGPRATDLAARMAQARMTSRIQAQPGQTALQTSALGDKYGGLNTLFGYLGQNQGLGDILKGQLGGAT